MPAASRAISPGLHCLKRAIWAGKCFSLTVYFFRTLPTHQRYCSKNLSGVSSVQFRTTPRRVRSRIHRRLPPSLLSAACFRARSTASLRYAPNVLV